jgi:hypothetical protein
VAVHPLISPAETQDQPDDIGVIDYPVKRSRAELAYGQTIDVDPDHAAQVLGTAKKLDEHPQFVDNNLDTAKRAAAMPTSDYFAKLEKEHPITHAYISDPQKMATAKDDIENLAAFERAAKSAVRVITLANPLELREKIEPGLMAEYKALQAGALQEQLHFLGYGKIVGKDMDSGTFTGQVWNKIIGLGSGQSPDERIATIEAQLQELEKARPEVKGPFSALGRGIFGATEFLPWMAGEATRGAEYAIGGAAAGALAGMPTGPGAAAPALAGGMALYPVGAMEYNFRRMAGMARIQLDQLRDDNGQPLPDDIKNIASLAAGAGGAGLGMIRLAAILKTIPGGEAFLKGFQSKVPEAILNPENYKSALVDYTKQWLSSTSKAAGVMGGLSALNIGITQGAESASGQPFQSFQMRQAISEVAASLGEGVLTFGVLGAPGTLLGLYSKMGDIAKESKLAKRMPEAMQEYMGSVVKDSPIETVGIPAEKFVTYFQEKNVDPMSVAKELGIEDQIPNALESGTDVQIPYSTWISKTVGTGHYEGLKDDIRFRPEDPTVNEVRERSETIGKQMEEEVAQAAKVNPGWSEGRQAVLDDMIRQLTATGVYNDKTAKSQAELATKVIERLAARDKAVSPAEWLKANPIRIINGQMEAQHPPATPDAPAVEWVNNEVQKVKPPKIKKVDIAAQAERMAQEAATTYEADRRSFDQWKEVLKAGIAAPKEIGGQRDVMDEYNQLPLWMKKKTGRGADEVAQEARQSGLLGDNEDIFVKLRELRAPGKAGKAEDFLDQARRDLEQKHYQTYLQGAIPDGDLFHVEKQNVSERFVRYMTDAKAQGLEDPQARKWAMEKLSAEQKPADHGPRAVQGEFGGGVAKMGAEGELFQSGLPKTDTPEFKNWFGESKVVDEKGNPKMVFRGDFRADLIKGRFLKGKSTSSRFYFTEDPEVASNYSKGKIYIDDSSYENWFKVGTGRSKDNLVNAWYKLSPEQQAKVKDAFIRAYKDEQTGEVKFGEPDGGIVSKDHWDYEIKQARGNWLKAGMETWLNSAALYDDEEQFGKILDKAGISYNFDNPHEGHSGVTPTYLSILNPIDAAKPPQEFVDAVRAWANKSRYVAKEHGEDAWDKTLRDPKSYAQELEENAAKGSNTWTTSIPDSVVKIAQKLGYDGIKDEGGKYGGVKNNQWIAFEPEQIKSPFNRGSFDRGSPNILNQGDPETDPRGFIRFTPKEALISIVKGKADESTFPHELAHYWLKNFHEFVQTGQAQENHMADWKILSDWLKIEEGQKDLTTDQQERFAKGFEAYLREGKAPSEDLRGVFAKFRRWLTRLYRDPATLGIELNPNVRGVMDRMLASEGEIAFAERNAGRDMEREINIEGLDPAIKGKLEKLRDQAHEEAISQLLRPQIQEISEEHKAFLAKERANATQKASDLLADNTELKAMDSVKEVFGKDAKAVAASFLGKTMKEGDIDALEVEAQKHGYGSADEMAKKIMDTPSRADQIKALSDQDMAKHAELRNRASIKEQALDAVHNEQQGELMALEESIFRMKVAEAQGRRFNAQQSARIARLEAMAAKMKAHQTIGAKSVRDAGKFMPYFTAERNAALKVQKALMDKDYLAAAEAKRKQLLNHSLVSESYKARNEIQKIMTFFDRFASRKQDLKDIPYGFIRQIDTLLSDRGLASARDEDAKTYLAIAQDMATKGADPEEISHATGWMPDGKNGWKPDTLADTIARIQEDYRDIAIPESVLTSRPIDYRSMSMADFRDLKQAVKAINGVGRGYDRFLDETIKMDRKEAAAKFREFVEKNIGTSYLEGRDIVTKQKGGFRKGVDAITHLPNAAIPSLVNLLSLTDVIDAKTPEGLGKKFIYRPLLHSEEGKARMVEQAVKDVNALLKQHFAKDEYEKLRKESIYIKSRDGNMTRDELLSFALNWGNEHGRQRLIDSYQLNPEQIQEILSNIPKNHLDFAQSVWNYMNSFWPKIVAQQQKVAGETPAKVKALPIETTHGRYEGGYYPLAYDYRKSNDAYRTVDARNALYKTMGSVMAHTEHGFTKSRVQNYKAPIRLDSRVIFDHLEDVIHDLNFRKAVIDVNGFLRQKDTREAITNAFGIDALKTIQTHLKWVASQQIQQLNGADKIIRKLRMGATVATLGLRPLQAPLSAGGNVINAMHEIGPVKFAGAIKEFLGDETTNKAFVDKRSMLMSQRAVIRDRDLTDLARRWADKDSLFQHYTFYMDSMSDKAISYPLWLSVYRGAVGEHGEQTAIDLANESVIKTMGSGRVLDQANIQRGTESQKLFSWWYSWSGMMFNRLWRDGKFAGLEYRKGNVATALTITANAALYGWVLQSANENLWRELFRNAQNVDEDKRWKRVFMRSIMQPVSYVPIYRDIAQAALFKMVGLPSGGFTVPFQDAVQTMVNPLAEMGSAAINDKEMSHRFWEDSARVAAITLKYPQILNTWAFNFIDYLNDDGDLTWKDLMSRRTKS